MSGCGSITSRYSDKLLNKSGGKLKKLSKKKPLYWPSEEKYPAESPIENILESIPPIFVLKNGRRIIGKRLKTTKKTKSTRKTKRTRKTRKKKSIKRN